MKRIEEKISDIPAMKRAIFETLNETKRLGRAINKLVGSEGRQDKILESLALRSLKQETEIKEIKRILNKA